MVQEVVQAVEKTVKDVLNNSVHTAMPAVIAAVYPEEGKVDAQPVGSFYCSGFEMEYPVVPGVPLALPVSAEGVGLCFPVKEGDGCLLVFAEQSTSQFLTEMPTAQNDERFELQNAMAIPGLARVFPEPMMAAMEENCAIVTAGENMVKVGAEGITLKAPSVRIESDEVEVTGRLKARTIYADTYQNLPI